MDEIEYLVNETYKHHTENFTQMDETLPLVHPVMEGENDSEFPEEPGIIYHVQKATSVFVIRTIVSANIRQDYLSIVERPEDYPSLRLLEGGSIEVTDKLKYFLAENPSQAEIIHDQLHNRRFPINEEVMCNLSDPGFSWWLTKRDNSFQLAFTMSVANDQNTVKLGPLGDRELAVKNFQQLEALITSAGIGMNIQNEMNRVQFTDCEEFILEELKDVFEFGVMTQTLKDLFKILSRKNPNDSSLKTTWFYLQEVAAMRRFWIQIQYDLNP